MKKFFVLYCEKNLFRPHMYLSLSSIRKKTNQNPKLNYQQFKSQLQAVKFMYPKTLSYLMINEKIEQKKNQESQEENEQKVENLNEIIDQVKKVENTITQSQKKQDQRLTKTNQILADQQFLRQKTQQLFNDLYSYQGKDYFVRSLPQIGIKSTIQYNAFFDGASKGNPGAAGIGYVVVNNKNQIVFKNWINIGHKTNNQAQFMAVVYLLLDCKHNNIANLRVFGDSQLVVDGINQKKNIQHPNLKYLNLLAKYLIKQFDEFSIHHIPRKNNSLADSLSNKGVKAKYLGKK